MKDTFNQLLKDPVIQVYLQGAEETPAINFGDYLGSLFTLKPLSGTRMFLMVTYSDRDLLTGIGYEDKGEMILISESLTEHSSLNSARKAVLSAFKNFS